MSEPGSTGFAQQVIAWQLAHGRSQLPWQRTRDPYRVWLAEIMLQQTQVATVIGYYERFLQRFADVSALAATSLDEVLVLWSGLGYYGRARNLHRCAQMVVSVHGGEFPRSSEQLAQLPGIGRSTAAAIAAFCFGERAAILDGNVKRVLTRVLGFEGDLSEAAHERALWARATALLPKEGIEAYTQGLMDLGASLCSMRSPRCQLCPIKRCVARRSARPEDYPVRTRKLRRTQRESWWLWLEWRSQVWLQQQPAAGVWAGLWTLPLFDSEAALRDAADVLHAPLEDLPAIKHSLTHFDWLLRLQRAVLTRKPQATWLAPGRWVAMDTRDAVALPAPLRRLLNTRAMAKH